MSEALLCQHSLKHSVCQCCDIKSALFVWMPCIVIEGCVCPICPWMFLSLEETSLYDTTCLQSWTSLMVFKVDDVQLPLHSCLPDNHGYLASCVMVCQWRGYGTPGANLIPVHRVYGYNQTMMVHRKLEADLIVIELFIDWGRFLWHWWNISVWDFPW